MHKLLIFIIALVFLFPSISMAANQHCHIESKDMVRLGGGKCPASTRRLAKFYALTPLMRACKFGRRINPENLIFRQVAASLYKDEFKIHESKNHNSNNHDI